MSKYSWQSTVLLSQKWLWQVVHRKAVTDVAFESIVHVLIQVRRDLQFVRRFEEFRSFSGISPLPQQSFLHRYIVQSLTTQFLSFSYGLLMAIKCKLHISPEAACWLNYSWFPVRLFGQNVPRILEPENQWMKFDFPGPPSSYMTWDTGVIVALMT